MFGYFCTKIFIKNLRDLKCLDEWDFTLLCGYTVSHFIMAYYPVFDSGQKAYYFMEDYKNY